jgi:NADH-quinone oxidoreductase subunit E
VEKEPIRLDAPREGGADDLKRIKGIGPKIEVLLNSMGIYHLDQIASWRPAEVAWMDEHLEDFRGRVSRDDWVAQARHLSGGGETEFSRRVDEGEVYD